MEILGANEMFWLSVAAAAGALEAISCCLISAWFVFGALAACLASAFGAGLFAQVTIFLVASGIGTLAIRPFVIRGRRDPETKEPTMEGEVLVVTLLPVDGARGRARDKRGMDWAIAVSDDVDPALAELSFGQRVRVVAQKSATLVIEPCGGFRN